MFKNTFQKINFENLKKLERIVNIFVIYIKIHDKAKNPTYF